MNFNTEASAGCGADGADGGWGALKKVLPTPRGRCAIAPTPMLDASEPVGINAPEQFAVTVQYQ